MRGLENGAIETASAIDSRKQIAPKVPFGVSKCGNFIVY
jgi:hypothetical protein